MERAKPISDVTTKRSRVFFKSLKQSAYPRREETREREGPGKRKETRREYYFKGEHSMRLISPSRRMDNDNVSTARGEKMGRIFERGKKYDAKVSANTTLPRRYNKNVFFSFLCLPSSAKSGSRGFGFFGGSDGETRGRARRFGGRGRRRRGAPLRGYPAAGSSRDRGLVGVQ